MPVAKPAHRHLDKLRRLPRRCSDGFDRLPIRTRLAVASALLTLIILCAFAIVVGSLTVNRIRDEFDRQVAANATEVASQLQIRVSPLTYQIRSIEPELHDLTTASGSVIKILSPSGAVLEETPAHAPSLGGPDVDPSTVDGYRVVTHPSALTIGDGGEQIGEIYVQYGDPVSSIDATVARVELLLVLGVLAGAGLSLLAGVTIARRAMAPIAQLTVAAAEIARTRDPSRRVPQPRANDEVAELAGTLEAMLRELDSARGETEAMLARQRQFVADASHELRTPLTSVLANLELLAESLHGDQGDAASSALRSSQRMRRLVADLLLLARTDVGRVVPRERLDLAQVVVEAAGELGPISVAHEISLDVNPAIVQAARDEIHRLVINLLENALRHTPPGTAIRVSTETTNDGNARVIIADEGPGVPPELTDTLFERFVRGAGDRGGSFGLGLSIVRAVTESHGGSVTVSATFPDARDGRRGACFTVLLPLAGEPGHAPADDVPVGSPIATGGA